MFNRNQDIKRARGNVPNWAIAEILGIHENTLCRWLRVEMDDEQKSMVMRAIDQVKEELRKSKQVKNA